MAYGCADVFIHSRSLCSVACTDCKHRMQHLVGWKRRPGCERWHQQPHTALGGPVVRQRPLMFVSLQSVPNRSLVWVGCIVLQSYV